jgi:hypothetical protein
MKKCLRSFLLLFYFLLFTFHFSLKAQNTLQPIGNWREHLNYQNTINVVKGDKVYCATIYGVFSVDANNEAERYSKVTGLNDIGVSCIGWDNVTQQLVIVYNNSNLDILKESIVKNIGDIKRSNVSANKTIYNIYCSNGFAYLSSGLGIIVVDLNRYEIKDTWFIGNNGKAVKTNGFTSDGSFYYAATDEGIKKASINSNNLSDFHNWTNPINSTDTITNIVYANNKMVFQKHDSLFTLNNNNFSLLFNDVGWQIVSINSSNNKILVCEKTVAGNSKVVQLNTNAVVEKIITQPNIVSFPKQAILDNNDIWTADYYGGLSKNASQQFIPNGPLGTADGQMIVANNTLFAAAGSVGSSWNYLYNRNGIYNFTNDEWNYVGYYNKPILDSVFDFIALAADARDNSIWAGSYGGGLVNFSGNNIKIYKQNSTLQPSIGDVGSYRVSGLCFDNNNNLWISNYGASQSLHVRKADGNFKAFSVPFSQAGNAVSQIVIDDANQLWIVSPRNGLICYNYGTSIDAVNDDQWKFYRMGIGNGNLPSNNVYCTAKDKDGFIWVGTDAGIAVIQCAVNTFNQNCDAVLPVVVQNGVGGYLFHDEEVHCIAVDGANRKWVGTKNGLWLISPSGDKIIYNFTEDNSPLLSNDIKSIAIDPQTGEVFIATFNGICSFRSTATEGEETNNNVLVFPNPVPPNFSGTIAIRGVAENSVVKIAELNGRLIYETRALGGQAVWDGKNYKGEKIASGVYLVLIKADDGIEKMVTKIVFIGK